MAKTLPQIKILFKQLVSSFITRSERGHAILIIKDSTSKTFTTKVYEKQEDLDADKALYTTDNYQYISDTFLGKPQKVTVVRIDAPDETNTTGGLISDALNIVKGLEVGWIGLYEPTEVQADQDAIVTFVKSQRDIGKNFKCIVFNPTTPPNNKGVTVMGNPKVIFTDTRGEVTGDKAIPTLAGALAGANVLKGTTYIKLDNFVSVTEPENVDTAINSGQLILINDGGVVRIGLGINSLTDPPDGKPDGTENDESYIEIVEAEDMIQDDISSTFKNNYTGIKNNLDNQILFINEVIQYLDGLASIDVLDDQYSNTAYIDTATQRQVLKDNGIDGVDDMTDAQIRQHTWKRDLYLAGDIKILFGMANLNFGVTLHS